MSSAVSAYPPGGWPGEPEPAPAQDQQKAGALGLTSAAINLAGIRQTAWIQNLTVVLKYLPLLFVAVVGWFFVSKANFGAFNASGGRGGTAVAADAVALHHQFRADGVHLPG